MKAAANSNSGASTRSEGVAVAADAASNGNDSGASIKIKTKNSVLHNKHEHEHQQISTHIISHRKLGNVALSLPRHHVTNNWSQQISTQTDVGVAEGSRPDFFSILAEGDIGIVRESDSISGDDKPSQSILQSSKGATIKSVAAAAAVKSGVSVGSLENVDVGDFDFLINAGSNIIHENDSSSGDDKSQSIQQASMEASIQSVAAHAVGVGADSALLLEIIEALDESSNKSEPEPVDQKRLSSSSKTKSAMNTPSTKLPSLNALGLENDDEPGKGGANEDAASMDISAITTTYTAPPTRKIKRLVIDHIAGQVIAEGAGDTVLRQDLNAQSGTTNFEVMDDKTDQVSAYSHDQMNEGMRASERGDEIGSILTNAIHSLDPKVLEECLLDLKKTSDISASEMAEKNIRLGNLAVESAALEAAVIYFRMGRGLLGPKAWEENPNAMLQLCSAEANACFATGDTETTNALVEDVLKRDAPVKEKFRAYEVKILSLQASQRFNESINTALDVRRQLGLRSPSNKSASTLNTLKEYIKTRRVLKNRTADELVALPDLTDESIIMGQRLLELIIPATYQVQPTLFPLVVFLLVRTSIEHGINASSCDAFACYGLLLR